MIARILPLLAVLAVSAAHAQSQPLAPQKTEQQQAPTSQSGEGAHATAPAVPPIHITVAGPEKTQAESEQEAQVRSRELAIQDGIKTATYVMASTAIAQALGTLFAFAVTLRAANAAKASADAIKLTERAQIGVPHDSWTSELRVGADPRYNLKLTYSIRNAGQTLGYFKLTVFHMRTGSGPNDEPLPMSFSQDDAAVEPWAVVLPGGSIPRDDYPFFMSSQDEIDKLASGELVYWTLGRISYRDLFGNVHYTNFTSRFHLPSKSFSFPLEKGYADGN